MAKLTTRAARLLLTLIVASLSALVIACSGEDDGGTSRPVAGAEVGVYYYTTDSEDEYTLTLSDGCEFLLVIDGGTKSGSYVVKDGNITFKFKNKADGAMAGTLTDNALNVDYNDKSMRFLKRVSYKVKFEGGGAVSDKTVINGKSVTEPQQPTQDNKIFVGWYKDEAYTTPFKFGTDIITSNTTLYAQWVNKTDKEYSMTLDDGVGNVTSETTKGGQLFDIVEPARDGYKFLGWWIATSDGTPSEKYTPGKVFKEDGTLIALWQSTDASAKLQTPIVHVLDKSITWESVEDAREYKLEITDPSGTKTTQTVTGTAYTGYDFSAKTPGVYTVSVTAVAFDASKNSDAAVRSYKNKVLSKVSGFTEVGDGVLLFGAVEHAQRYEVTINCGDPNHNHVKVNNGGSTLIDYSTCPMQEGGIVFTVVAKASGWADSEPSVKTIDRTLAGVTEYTLDEATQTVKWNAVEKATNYIVTVTGKKNGEDYSVTVDNGTSTSYSVKELEGKVTVTVKPQTAGYNSPKELKKYEFEKTRIATPSNLAVVGNKVTWSAVTGATSYEVTLGGKTYVATTNELDITTLNIDMTSDGEYSLTVKAKKDGEVSPESETFAFGYRQTKLSGVTYKNGTVSWNGVLGASSYKLKVNDGDEITVDANKTSVAVTLTNVGVNKIKVGFVSLNTPSEWTEIEVTAYKVEFSTREGTEVATQYKAVGDTVTLPTSTTRTGYTLDGWYSVPSANGQRYGDTFVMTGVDKVVYANWQAKTYTVELNLSDGTKLQKDVTFGKGYSLDTPTPTDGSLGFVGWFTGEGGTGSQLTNELGSSLAVWATDSSDTVRLYPKWRTVFEFKLLSDGTYSVTKSDGAVYFENLVIPATYEGVKVSVVEAYAFRNCSSLKTVSMPDTVTLVEVNTAFDGCDSLESVSVYHVDGNVDVTYFAENGILTHKDEVTGEYEIAFIPPTISSTVRIPYGVTHIPTNTFNGKNMERVIVPSSVRSVGMRAFANCPNLVSIIFETDNTGNVPLTLDGNAVFNCQSLVSVQLPSRLTGFTPDVFAYCYKLLTVDVAAGGLYSAKDGVVCSESGTKLVYCPLGKTGAFTIPTGVTKIGENAFKDCSRLTDIVIPGYVTEIGNNAFAGCTRLATVAFKGSAITEQTIGKSAFGECTSLREVTFEQGCNVVSIGESAFESCYVLASISLPATLTEVKAGAFKNCKALGTVNFPNGGAELSFGENAFQNCTALTVMNLPASLTHIDNSVFKSCENLRYINVDPDNQYYTDLDGILYDKDITEVLYIPKASSNLSSLPDTVKKIGDGTFKNNVNITSFTIGWRVEYIGKEAFAGCSNLQTLTFAPTPDGETEVALTMADGNGSYSSNTLGVFYGCSSLTEVELPTRLSRIGGYAFNKCTSLKSITIPGTYSRTVNDDESVTETRTGVQEIGTYAFYECSALETVSVPGSVKVIGEAAFYGTWSGSPIKQIELGYGVEELGRQAFAYCKSLTEITIPATVKKVGPSVFSDCSNIKKIEFEEDLDVNDEIKFLTESYGVSAYTFSNCTALSELVLPSRLTEMPYYMIYQGSSLKTLTIPQNVTTISNCAISQSSVETIIFEAPDAGKYDLEFLLPTSSWDYKPPFYSCQKLKEIIGLNKRVTKIPDYFLASDYAYYASAAFTTIDLSGITEIGEYAFKYCTALNNLDLSNITKIGNGAFSNCTALKAVTIGQNTDSIGADAFKGTGLTSFDFSSVKTIGDNAFMDSKLVTIDLGSVEEIGANAFAGSALTSVTIPKTVKSIGSDAFKGCLSLTTVSFESADGDDDVVSLTIADGTTSDYGVFAGCKALTSVNGLPLRLEELPKFIFGGSNAIQSITVEGCEDAETLAFADGVSYASYQGVLYEKQGLDVVLKYCPAGKEGTVTVPSSVTVIAAMAFNGCSKVTAIEFQEVQEGDDALPLTIGDLTAQSTSYGSVFYGSGITSVELPARTTVIGAYAFATDTSASVKLTSVTIPGASGSGDSALTGVVQIGKNAFQYTAIQTLTVPASVSADNFGENAVANCSSLASLTIPSALVEKVVSITDAAITFSDGAGSGEYLSDDGVMYRTVNGKKQLFKYSKLLTATSYTIPNDVELIAANAFKGNSVLTEVIIPASVKEIGASAFEGCTALDTVTLNEGLTTIGENAFKGCTKLTAIELTESVTTIGNGAFQSSGLTSVTITTGVTSLGNEVFKSCTSLLSATFDNDDFVITSTSLFYGCNKLNGVEIPSATKKLPSKLFYNCSSLSAVTFADNITEVGDNVFYGCSSLAEIVLPETVAFVGEYAFASSGIKEMVFPASVTTLEMKVVADCYALKKVVLKGIRELNCTTSGWYKYSPFSGCGMLEEVQILGETTVSIGDEVFYYLSGLKSVSIPASVMSIGKDAFRNCSSLKTVTIASGSKLQTITDYAFNNCNVLSSFPFENLTDLTSVGNYAFYNCYQLPSAHFSADRLYSLGDYVFYNCRALETVTLPSRLKTLGNYAFTGCSGLMSIDIPATLESIGNSAFYNCGNLDGVVLPSGLTSMGTSVFEGCVSLTSINLPAGITSIGTMFAGCTSLSEIEIPMGVQKLDNTAFSGCSSLQSIVIPDSVVSIGNDAFLNCVNLETVVMSSNTVTIGDRAFMNCVKLQSVTFPNTVSVLGAGVFSGCDLFTQYAIDDDSAMYSIVDGILYDAEGHTLISVPAGRTGSLTIPEGTTAIAASAFAGSKLDTVIFANSVTEVGEYAFNGSAVSSVTLPENLKILSRYMFNDCKNLTEIELPAGLINIVEYAFLGSGLTEITIPGSCTNMGQGIVSECEDLETITFSTGIKSIPRSAAMKCPSLTTVNFASTIESIGDYAFYQTGLAQVTVPSNVKKLGAYAFGSCSSLTSVTLSEGVESLDTEAFSYCENLTSVNFPSTLTTLNAKAFYHCRKLAAADMSASKIEVIGDYAFDTCEKLSNLKFCSTLTKIGSWAFQYCYELQTVTLPASLKSLSSYAFNECTSLTSINLGNLTEIGSYALKNCYELTSVTLTSVEVLGSYCFAYCKKLGSVSFAGNTVLKQMGDGVFASYYDYGTSTYTTALTSITLPSSLESMGSYVFEGCVNLTSVTFGEDSALKSIGSGAFKKCTGISSITFPSSMVSVGETAFANWTAEQTINFGCNRALSGNWGGSYSWSKWDGDCNAVIHFADDTVEP